MPTIPLESHDKDDIYYIAERTVLGHWPNVYIVYIYIYIYIINQISGYRNYLINASISILQIRVSLYRTIPPGIPGGILGSYRYDTRDTARDTGIPGYRDTGDTGIRDTGYRDTGIVRSYCMYIYDEY